MHVSCSEWVTKLVSTITVWGTAAAAPPPFRPSDPALCGSCPLVTPYYCRLGDLLYIICVVSFVLIIVHVQCESKKIPPPRFSAIFPKRLGIFNQFLHTYYVIISTLDYKFLFIYLQLWQSYVILSATT